MRIIEQLQRSRPEIVHVFDEIVRTLPEGVYLTSVKQNSLKLKFDGVAQSSTRVSSFMRNIDASDWLKNPELEVVQTAKSGSTGGSSFTLTADEVSMATQDDANGDGKGKKGVKGGNKVMASNGGRQ
jgi:type IV pilus assembly protein PilN